MRIKLMMTMMMMMMMIVYFTIDTLTLSFFVTKVTDEFLIN